jgi:hypothetical protein
MNRVLVLDLLRNEPGYQQVRKKTVLVSTSIGRDLVELGSFLL